MFSFTGKPCHARNLFVHRTFAILSSTAITSDSVELRELTFCLLEPLVRAPLPMVKTAPVWLFMSACTANAASMYQVKVLVSLASKVKTSSIVPFKKLITRSSLIQSPSLGSFTLEDRNTTPGSMSGLALLHRNIAFITKV